MIFPVIILAGGKATRLGKIAKNTPKSLIKINNHPFLYHQLIYLEKQGIKEVIICAGHLGFKIKKFIEKKKINLKIKYFNDGKKLLGTGGAIKKILPFLKNNFFVMYGDSYLPINFRNVQKLYINSKKLGLITIYKNKNKLDKSNIILKSGNIYYDKFKPIKGMHYIDYGLNILNKRVFKYFNLKKKFDLAEVLNLISKKNLLTFMLVKKRFYEIGSLHGIKDTEDFLNK
jgi:NDP-sugar pyrophosphorylase family protein